MPPIAEPPKKKKPFSVFEAGSGVLSTAIVRKAAASEKNGRNRVFTGVDKNLNKSLSVLFAGKLKMPATLSLKRADVLNVMASVPAKSQSIENTIKLFGLKQQYGQSSFAAGCQNTQFN